MKTTRALRYRLRAATRWMLGRGVAGPWALAVPFAVLVGLVLAGVGLVALGEQLAGGAPSSGLAAPGLAAADVGERVFRLGLVQALVLCYTTFEVLYRARDAHRVRGLPVSGGARFSELTVVALACHVPLLLPSLAWAATLWLRGGAGGEAAFVLAYGALQVGLGVPVALLLHLLAGRTLARPEAGAKVKQVLAGAVLPTDAALLVYAPAAAFLVLSVLGVVVEIPLARVARGESPAAVLAFLGVGAVLGLLAWRQGRAVAEADLHRILPRFAEADVPPPYRDDGVARRVRGSGLARLLPAAARPYFLRDLRQLRRRFRLDGLLLVASPLVAWQTAETLYDGLLVFGYLLVLGLTSGFRLVGRELSAPGLERTLPGAPSMARLGRTAASAVDPLLLAAAVGLGHGLAGGGVMASVALALSCMGLALGWVGLVAAVAASRGPESAGLAAALTRAAALCALAFSGGWA